MPIKHFDSQSLFYFILFYLILFHYSLSPRPQTNTRSPTRQSLRHQARHRCLLLPPLPHRTAPLKQPPRSILVLILLRPCPCCFQFHLLRRIYPRPSPLCQRTPPRSYRRPPTIPHPAHPSRPPCP